MRIRSLRAGPRRQLHAFGSEHLRHERCVRWGWRVRALGEHDGVRDQLHGRHAVDPLLHGERDLQHERPADRLCALQLRGYGVREDLYDSRAVRGDALVQLGEWQVRA